MSKAAMLSGAPEGAARAASAERANTGHTDVAAQTHPSSPDLSAGPLGTDLFVPDFVTGVATEASPAPVDDRWAYPDDEDPWLPLLTRSPHRALRLPDGRTWSWAEYGSPRGVPCVLLPDRGSSRLAPNWLLHDEQLPSTVRLLAVDRPGVGASDPIGLGGREQPAEDLRRMVETLAVGRVALVAVGAGADEAFAFASRYPMLVASVDVLSPRLPGSAARRPWRRSGGAARAGAVASWMGAAGRHPDLTRESTWARIARSSAASALLGDRWRDEAFRLAVAEDVAESGRDWATHATGPAGWVAEPPTLPLPVRLWCGEDEVGTTAEQLSAFVGTRPNWSVATVPGPSAVLGAWTTVLETAALAWTAPGS